MTCVEDKQGAQYTLAIYPVSHGDKRGCHWAVMVVRVATLLKFRAIRLCGGGCPAPFLRRLLPRSTICGGGKDIPNTKVGVRHEIESVRAR